MKMLLSFLVKFCIFCIISKAADDFSNNRVDNYRKNNPYLNCRKPGLLSCFNEKLGRYVCGVLCNGVSDCDRDVDEEDCNCSFLFTNTSGLIPALHYNRLKKKCKYTIILPASNSSSLVPAKNDSVIYSSSNLNNDAAVDSVVSNNKNIINIQVRKEPVVFWMNFLLPNFEIERKYDSSDYVEFYNGLDDKDQLLARHTKQSLMGMALARDNMIRMESQSNVMTVIIYKETYTTWPLFEAIYQQKGVCLANQLKCSHENDCYFGSMRCDGVWDCRLDGSDEQFCDNCGSSYSCHDSTLTCYDRLDRCDGHPKCSNEADEKFCEKSVCNKANGTFLCLNKKCIRYDWVCDGVDDCKDASDEVSCPLALVESNHVALVVSLGTMCGLIVLISLIMCSLRAYALKKLRERRSSNRRIVIEAAVTADMTSSRQSLLEAEQNEGGDDDQDFNQQPSSSSSLLQPTSQSSSNNAAAADDDRLEWWEVFLGMNRCRRILRHHQQHPSSDRLNSNFNRPDHRQQATHISPITEIQNEIFARLSAPPPYQVAMATSRSYDEVMREKMMTERKKMRRRERMRRKRMMMMTRRSDHGKISDAVGTEVAGVDCGVVTTQGDGSTFNASPMNERTNSKNRGNTHGENADSNIYHDITHILNDGDEDDDDVTLIDMTASSGATSTSSRQPFSRWLQRRGGITNSNAVPSYDFNLLNDGHGRDVNCVASSRAPSGSSFMNHLDDSCYNFEDEDDDYDDDDDDSLLDVQLSPLFSERPSIHRRYTATSATVMNDGEDDVSLICIPTDPPPSFDSIFPGLSRDNLPRNDNYNIPLTPHDSDSRHENPSSSGGSGGLSSCSNSDISCTANNISNVVASGDDEEEGEAVNEVLQLVRQSAASILNRRLPDRSGINRSPPPTFEQAMLEKMNEFRR